jgi:propanediol utilization protein
VGSTQPVRPHRQPLNRGRMQHLAERHIKLPVIAAAVRARVGVHEDAVLVHVDDPIFGDASIRVKVGLAPEMIVERAVRNLDNKRNCVSGTTPAPR